MTDNSLSLSPAGVQKTPTPSAASQTAFHISPYARKRLLLIIGIGLIFRIIVGYVQPTFCDEAYVYYVTKAGWSQLMHEIRFDVHPPTINIFLYPLIQNTKSIFILRLPQIFLSCLTMWLVFLLSRRYFADKAALLITACFSFSHYVWLTDAQLRTYGPLACASTALILGVLTIAQYGRPYAPYLTNHPKWQWPLFTAAALGCSCLHASGVLIMFTAFAAFLFPQQPADRRTRLRVLSVLALTVMPIIAWAMYVKLTLPVTPERYTYVVPAKHLIYAPVDIITGLSAEALQDRFGGTLTFKVLGAWLPPCFLFLDTAFWLFYMRGLFMLTVPEQAAGQRASWERLFVFSAFAAPFGFLYLANVLGVLSWQSRYMSTLLAPFYIMVFAGAARWGQNLLSTFILSVNGIVLLCFPNCTWLWNQYWQSTIDFIEQHQHPGDHIAVHIPATCYCFTMAYDLDNIQYVFSMQNNSNVQIKQQPAPGKLDVLPLNARMVSPALINDYWKNGRVFLILTQSDNHTADMINTLNSYYTVTDYHEHKALHGWGSATTYLLQRK